MTYFIKLFVYLFILDVDPQVHTYKVSHSNFHSVRIYMISRETSVFTSHPRRGQCVLHQECVPLPRAVVDHVDMFRREKSIFHESIYFNFHVSRFRWFTHVHLTRSLDVNKKTVMSYCE